MWEVFWDCEINQKGKKNRSKRSLNLIPDLEISGKTKLNKFKDKRRRRRNVPNSKRSGRNYEKTETTCSWILGL